MSLHISRRLSLILLYMFTPYSPRLLYSPPYVAVGGYLREEGIMFLRRFYISTNENAPKPKNKANRVLKHEIAEVMPSRTASPAGEISA